MQCAMFKENDDCINTEAHHCLYFCLSAGMQVGLMDSDYNSVVWCWLK